jgi:hypothetical protein
MKAPRALRCYRGPDDPSPMMETVNTLSHHLRNMANSSDARKILRLEQNCEGGYVEIVRVNNVDYIYTKLHVGLPVFIFKLSGGTKVFVHSLRGKLERWFDTDSYGDIVSADKNGVHLFNYVDYLTASNYSKYNYKGKELYSKDYSAGEISYAIGYLNHDVIMSWETPGVWDTNVNTCYLKLYKNYELVKTVSKTSTADLGESFSAAAINDYGVVASVRQTVHAGGGGTTEYRSWIEYYDFNLNLLYTSEIESRPNTGPEAFDYAYDVHTSRNLPFYAVYTYSLGKQIKYFKYDKSIKGFQSGTEMFMTTIYGNPATYYMGNSLGIVYGKHYVWAEPVTWDNIVRVFPYNLRTGEEGTLISFNTQPEDYNLDPGCMAIVNF